MLYINFYFVNILFDENYYMGKFISYDDEVECDFEYNRKTKELMIWNNNKPTEEILPLPIHWLDWKLKEKGCLDQIEKKISY